MAWLTGNISEKGRAGEGGGVLRTFSDGNDRIGANIKPQKIPRASNKTQKNPWTKYHEPPKNPMPNVRALKFFRKD